MNVTAKNETEARRIYNDSKIKSLRCIKEGKKGFLGLGSPSSEYELEIQEPAVVKITFVTPILIKVTVGSVRNEILIMSEGLAGGWPPELSRETFKTIDLDALVAELKRYQEMPHPQDPVMALTAELLDSNMPPNRPDYEMIDNKIARRSWPMEDSMLLTTAEYLKGRGNISPTDNETIVSWAMELIQHYAGTKLAKFLFHLPRIDEMIKSGANQKLIIVEYYSIDCYKGIENILFEIYAELGQGQTFSDKAVTDKLVSLVNKIANG